jgi:hypothetical protein
VRQERPPIRLRGWRRGAWSSWHYVSLALFLSDLLQLVIRDTTSLITPRSAVLWLSKTGNGRRHAHSPEHNLQSTVPGARSPSSQRWSKYSIVKLSYSTCSSTSLMTERVIGSSEPNKRVKKHIDRPSHIRVFRASIPQISIPVICLDIRSCWLISS